jgi:oxalate decarboxylase/phosphoglucose isomerase-like protein (cupin superfamily)
MLRSLLLLVGVCFAASGAMAQDPVKVDPQHYKVIFENDQVRVLRIHYGPHEKSVMHVHPNAVVVYESDAHMKMTTPDGKSVVSDGKAGDSQWTPAGAHLPENAGDKPVDAVLVELKAK